VPSPATPSPAEPLADAVERRAGVLASLHETTKPGISRLVTITAGVGFAMAHFATQPARSLADTAAAGLACLIGTYFSAGGANALNQWAERLRDARMDRTKRRPLPQDRLSPRLVGSFGIACAILGALILALGCGPIPALLAALSTLVYLFIYTPLKPRSVWSTYVGTMPGALPPLIGWAAGSDAIGADSLRQPGGWSLFVLMTVWQLPHSFALAWMYKDDYERGGYRLLPVVDPTGSKTSLTIAVWALAQTPATLSPVWAMPDILGWPYASLAILTGLWYFAFALRLLRTRAVADARKIFFVSILHLPLLMIAMVAEAACRRLF
jgi:protoheme IX farnesyltransferase